MERDSAVWFMGAKCLKLRNTLCKTLHNSDIDFVFQLLQCNIINNNGKWVGAMMSQAFRSWTNRTPTSPARTESGSSV